ncbi:MAG TPA: choice-of-anchor D domain-containing protein, partial [Candidatus Polarisedimenticolia bacterium]|nr:choice-of-anchor D domain-containing protein [Candidatus Polarisedimenticolia bacterium]
PPGPILDLSAGDPTSNSIVLSWSATGDDGDVGKASFYDLRYATAAIDEAGFADATPVPNAPPPGPSGGAERFEVGGLSPDTVYFFAIKAGDEWGNVGPLSNVASGRTLPPPTLSTGPSSFSVALLSGQTTTRTLTIENAGEGTLDWRIPQPGQAAAPAGRPFPSPALARSDSPAGRPAIDGRGGPDEFGYAFSDSDQSGGPAFDWIDIAASGTPIAGLQYDDRTSEPIPLGFDMPFYGKAFNSVSVSTNGFLSFTSSRADYSNQPLPNPVAPENLVAPFWDDLDLSAHGSVVYAADGASFTVQYTGVRRFNAPGECTFQVTLYRSGEIVFRYLSITAETESSTIGIQNSSGTVGLNVSFNARYVHDQLAVRIVPPARWIAVAPGAGRLSGGESQDVTLTLDAQGLEAGGYAASLIVESNDPLRPRVEHPITLDVTGAPAIRVRPALLDFGTVFSGFARTLELTVDNIGTELLNVGGITSADPTVTANPSSFTLSARTQTRVAVTYAPGSPGVLDGTLSIASDASNSPNLLIGVTGLSAPAPQIGAAPTSFNESLLTGGTLSRRLTIRNSGGSALLVHLTTEASADEGASGAAAPQPEWLRVAPADGVIAPGELQDFDLFFDADSFDAGVLVGAVRIDTNIPDLPPLSVPATLTVIGAPNIRPSPDRLDFGSAYVGYGKSLVLTVSNDGPEPLEVARVETDQPEFSVSPPSLSLPPRGSGRITVTLTPSSSRPFAGNLEVESNDPDSPLVGVALAGVGVEPPVIEVDPPALQATLRIGEQQTRSLAIMNVGPSPLQFSLGVQPRTPGAGEPGALATCLPARVLVNEFDGGRLSAVDLVSGAVTVVASGLEGPNRGLALNGAGTRAYVAESLSGRLSVVDLATGNVTRLASGMGFPSGVAVTKDERLAFVAERNGGELSRVDLSAGTVTRIVSGLKEPVQVALNAAESKAFVAEFASGKLSIVDLPTRSVLQIASGLSSISDMAINATATIAYVTEWDSGELSVVSLENGSITRIASGLSRPAGIDVDPLDTTAYVSEAGSGELSSVGLSTGAVTRIAGGLSLPTGAAVDVPAECRGGFLKVLPTSGTVEPFGSKSVEVRFSALSLVGGLHEADIVIESNDPRNPEVKVPAALTVLSEPRIHVFEAGLAFGTVFIGGRATRTLTVANIGTDTLAVSDIRADDGTFSATPSSLTLLPGETRGVSVDFAPGRTGAFAAILTITSNDPDRPLLPLALSGTGVMGAPAIQVSGTALDLGPAFIGG